MNATRPSRLPALLLAAIALATAGPAYPSTPPAAAPAPSNVPAAPPAAAPKAPAPAPAKQQAPAAAAPGAVRLENFYDITTASAAELKRVNADNAAIRRIRIGDTQEYLTRRLGKPRSVEEKSKGTPGYHRILSYDDLDVRVDNDGRISRIRVLASGAWIMRNRVRGLMQDFSETSMRRLFGWNYRRQLKRVYVWRIDRNRFAQDQDPERLARMVQQYYKLPDRAAAEKKIIRAWDTVYVYPARGLRMRVYSNIPISGRFKADFLLVTPEPPGAPRGKPAPPAATGPPGAAPPAPATAPAPEWPRDHALEAQLARRGIRGVTVLRQGRSLRLRGTVRDDRTLRRLYATIREMGYGEVDYGVEVRWQPASKRR